MALGGVDLNLLITLQALLEEANVTRAGQRVGMPQPAMSTALARLRRHYKDELLVRAGNGYTLTPLARSLLPEVQESTRSIGSAFSTATPRQPPGDGRTFTVYLSGYSIVVLGRLLQRQVNELAPDVSLELMSVSAGLFDGDRSQLQYDLLIASREFLSGSLGDRRPEVVCRDRFVYVADPANPRLRDGQLTLADLAALPHAAARLPYPEGDAVADALHRLGVRPEVAITTAGWVPLLFVVGGTDLVAAVPERLARQLGAAAGVAVIEPPFGTVEFVESAWWHPLHATDPGLTWLRSLVAGVAASLALPPALPGQRQPGNAT
jgi:DNA-binding transcriptional LysR family regulator